LELLPRAITRPMMLMERTVTAIRRAPTQPSRCQSSKADKANWKIVVENYSAYLRLKVEWKQVEVRMQDIGQGRSVLLMTFIRATSLKWLANC